MTVRQGRLNGSTSKSTSNVSLYLLKMCIGWLVEVGWWRCGARGWWGGGGAVMVEVMVMGVGVRWRWGGGGAVPDHFW